MAQAGSPQAGVSAALLFARILLGAALLSTGAERVGLANGTCLRDPAPLCETEEQAACGADGGCLALVAARCKDARAAACTEAGQLASRFFASRAILHDPAMAVPGPGRLWLLGTGAVEALCGLLLLLGLWARLAAWPAMATLLLASLTSLSLTWEAGLSSLTEPAMLQTGLALWVAMLGAGRWSVDGVRGGGKAAGASKSAGAKAKGQTSAVARLAGNPRTA